MSSACGLDHMGIDGESSSGWSPKSRDEDSRASSIEKDVHNINLSSDQSNSTSAVQTPSGKVSTKTDIYNLYSSDIYNFYHLHINYMLTCSIIHRARKEAEEFGLMQAEVLQKMTRKRHRLQVASTDAQ